jgi:hypothetical protein
LLSLLLVVVMVILMVWLHLFFRVHCNVNAYIQFGRFVENKGNG